MKISFGKPKTYEKSSFLGFSIQTAHISIKNLQQIIKVKLKKLRLKLNARDYPNSILFTLLRFSSLMFREKRNDFDVV